MALTNAQYDKIGAAYEETRMQNAFELQKRKERIAEEIPQYSALDAQIASLHRKYLMDLMQDTPGTKEKMAAERRALSEKKRELLLASGYSPDYLEMRYVCEACKDTGWIGRQKCHCLESREIEVLYKQSNVATVLEKENFRTLDMEIIPPEQKAAYMETVAFCKAYVDRFPEGNPDSHNRNVLFMGRVGTGKTFLTNCIAKALLDKLYSVIYFSSADFFDTAARYAFGKDKEEYGSFQEDIYNCDLLIIDDLGTEMRNALTVSTLFSLINEREIRGKATILSTNLDIVQLRDDYSERTASRLVSKFDILLMDGKDLRMA